MTRINKTIVNRCYLDHAVRVLRAGGVIAYPTEGVFGLGCDAENPDAVRRLLALKCRRPSKGLIVAIAGLHQLKPYVSRTQYDALDESSLGWPGPNTWLIENDGLHRLSSWVRGRHSKVAWRVPGHAIPLALCQVFGGPIISTSANRQGRPPELTAQGVMRRFPRQLGAVVASPVGRPGNVSTIRDLKTGVKIR